MSGFQKAQLVSGTRVHRRNNPNRNQPVSQDILDNLRALEERAKGYCGGLLVAYDSSDALLESALVSLFPSSTTTTTPDFSTHLVPIQPWASFIPALNSLIISASQIEPKPDYLLLQSVEAYCDIEEMGILWEEMKEQGTLVVGKRLDGHEFQATFDQNRKKVHGRGTTVPWNTLALWDLSRLALTGFLLVSEGLEKGVAGGVEEVSVLALHQRLWPDKSRAKLVDIVSPRSAGESWRTNWTDPDRQKWQIQKMASKTERPAKHLQLLGFAGEESILVEHMVSHT